MPSSQKRFAVRLPDELVERLAQVASEEGRSVNNMIQYILRRWLDEDRERRRERGE